MTTVRTSGFAIGLLLCANLALAQVSDGAPPTGSPEPAADKAKPGSVQRAKRQPSAKQLAQRAKMKRCNELAGQKALKGQERKQFMRGCLSRQPAEAAGTAQ